MARIQTYGLDINIDPNDMWIGTDGANGAGYATKNFTAGGLAAWIVEQIDTGSLSLYTHPNHSGDVISNADLEQTIQSVAISGKSTKASLLGTEEFLLNYGGNLYKTSLNAISTFVETNVTSTGTPGPDGDPGDPGVDGLSAYEVAVVEGFVGTEEAWLVSLVGAEGLDGLSAYEVAVTAGFVGTETDWLASLVGAEGGPGPRGVAGVIGLTYRGDYEAATTYVTSDVVRSTVDGNAYFLQTGPTTGAEPSTDSNWALFVMEGADGPQGEPGAAGSAVIDNVSKVIYVYESDLAAGATLEDRIATYVNTLNYNKEDIFADVWVEYSDASGAVTVIKYGYLYNWYTVDDARNIANTGWSVPTTDEFTTLQIYLGGSSVTGGKIKETGLTYWNSPNTGATNETNFNAKGTGTRVNTTGIFTDIKSTSYTWLSRATAGEWGNFQLTNGISSANISWSSATSFYTYGYTIRLMKDTTTLSNGQTGTYTGNDGKVYRTICIGTQEWLADNLVETKYRNNDSIPEVTDNTAWVGLTTGARCSYDNNESNAI